MGEKQTHDVGVGDTQATTFSTDVFIGERNGMRQNVAAMVKIARALPGHRPAPECLLAILMLALNVS